MSGYPITLNGDHAEFEAEWAGKDPKTRPDWPMPSFNAMDWAEAYCKVAADLGYRDRDGKPIEADWMVSWFAGALMRGFDEHAAATSKFEAALNEISTHWACDYDHPKMNTEMYRGSYGIGVVDGHRACKIIADRALAPSNDDRT